MLMVIKVVIIIMEPLALCLEEQTSPVILTPVPELQIQNTDPINTTEQRLRQQERFLCLHCSKNSI